ncbi:hypothetical protein NG271_494 [Saccharomyces cerevisiae synthetic construct]|uniref:Putative uncharacterized protein YDR230W n=2 Tax=Saccharomyces cerevisiae TaxID=4932 RepID=YD230_YEAST|nr:RecName: Full=Putative uncharacterized protein YDR230W [Saccharomyces cerevisiae S288C]AHX39266.1 hypothetical protein YDR230W [Saccharomyces cerevisiae]KZV12468.1 hypothetical protein WN66_01299 [Saccharomyces cerevisiae]WNF20049.1 hypothetical protein NG271_494 [Saccharomyces cerevisiae synthetic construct]CAY78730.1 EC1118_1D0_5028p [Saccharomyces cerevisiae EC1118]
MLHIYIGKRLKGPASTFCFPLVLFTRTCTISSQRRPEINSGYFVQTDSAFHFWRPPIAPAEMGHEGHYGALVFPFSPRFPLPIVRSGNFFVSLAYIAPIRQSSPVSESSSPNSWP